MMTWQIHLFSSKQIKEILKERKATYKGLKPTSPEYILDTLPTELTGQLEIAHGRPLYMASFSSSIFGEKTNSLPDLST